MIRLILGKFSIYGRVIMATLFVIVVGIASIQTIRANNLAARSAEYSRKISELEQAVLLTEKLNKDNAILTQERDDLIKELERAQGYGDLLPPDIRRIVNGRMR